MNQAIAQTHEALEARLGAMNLSSDRLLPEVDIVTRAWFNPRMRSAVFTVPGVLGLVLLVITTMLTALGLTREKEIGTLEQIMVTPIRPWQLILGKSLPFAIIGMADVVLIICAAALIFDIPVMGPLWGLLGAAALFLMTTLGLGLFISTISATQQQAMMNAFFVNLPLILLSGFIYPVENMPEAVQWLTIANPLRYFIHIVRGIMVKGATPLEIWDSLLCLAVLGLAVLAAASLRFKKRLS
jgi:ABC-2 type transport system permease protein